MTRVSSTDFKLALAWTEQQRESHQSVCNFHFNDLTEINDIPVQTFTVKHGHQKQNKLDTPKKGTEEWASTKF